MGHHDHEKEGPTAPDGTGENLAGLQGTVLTKTPERLQAAQWLLDHQDEVVVCDVDELRRVYWDYLREHKGIEGHDFDDQDLQHLCEEILPNSRTAEEVIDKMGAYLDKIARQGGAISFAFLAILIVVIPMYLKKCTADPSVSGGNKPIPKVTE